LDDPIRGKKKQEERRMKMERPQELPKESPQELPQESPQGKELQGFSRRNFLKGAAFGAASLTASLTASGMFLGCSAADEDESKGGGSKATTIEVLGHEFDVIETELLVLGTGNSALSATWQALKEGRTVAMIDKAIFRKSGASGWSWSCYSQMPFPTELGDLGGWLVDMPLWKNVLTFWNNTWNPEEYDNAIYEINHGQTAPERTEAGQVRPFPAEGWHGKQYFRHEMDQMKTMTKATVYDNTMVTNLLIQDGKCLGVIGVHIPTGRFKVFRAKATINCSGSAQWLYGWVKTKPVSLGGIDNTGDLLAIQLRNGFSTAENEFCKYDFPSCILRVTYGLTLGADYIHAGNFIDKDGKPLFDNPGEIDTASKLAQAVARAISEGRGSEDGGAWLTYDEDQFGTIERSEVRKFIEKELGIDPIKEPIEVLPEVFEKFGGPLVDGNLMTEVEGLFDCRGAGGCSLRATPSIAALLKIYGGYAGHTASQYVQANGSYPTKVDTQSIIDEIERLTEIRVRESSNGIRPHVIRETIQKGYYANMSLIRTKEGLEGYLAELVRIRKEDMPNMSIVDHSSNWNKEWKEAIENYNLLDVAESSVRATLMREESRYQYIRPDYPNVDDENWRCYIVVKNVGGTFELSKQEIPTL
jgi:succinate dehydrogenase / fumarate reductase flavoprotein subunit